MLKEDIYVKQHEAVLINKENRFMYEVSVFCRYKGYFGLTENKLYSCNQEIPGIISHFFRDAHTEIVCTLFSAPLPWLLDNDYVKYVKPDKKTIIKPIKTIKNGKSKTTIGKQRSWRPDGETDST
jgi:hypothetical protein